jgi:hypothetical protein
MCTDTRPYACAAVYAHMKHSWMTVSNHSLLTQRGGPVSCDRPDGSMQVVDSAGRQHGTQQIDSERFVFAESIEHVHGQLREEHEECCE